MRTKKIKILVFFCGVFIATLLIDGSFIPKNYLEPWDESYSHYLIDRRLKVVSKGLLAPNAFNRQPWRITLDVENHENFTLYVDTERLLPDSDPFSRQITMSQGAFLENLEISASNFGYEANIQLFPMGEYDSQGSEKSISKHPVAKINIALSNAEVNPLYSSINQGALLSPVLNRSLKNDELKSLLQVNKVEDLTVLIFRSEQDVSQIKQLTIDAMAVKLKVKLNDEVDIYRFTEWEKNKYRDGLAFTVFNFSLPEQLITQSMSKLISAFEASFFDVSLNRFRKSIAQAPAYLFILSQGNSRTNQVAAGRLYTRLFYTAQKLGLAIQPVVQALQTFPEMKAINQLIHQKYAMFGQTIQMLAIIGEPSEPISQSPRRDVLSLISNLKK